jgi:hypothetical protein
MPSQCSGKTIRENPGKALLQNLRPANQQRQDSHMCLVQLGVRITQSPNRFPDNLQPCTPAFHTLAMPRIACKHQHPRPIPSNPDTSCCATAVALRRITRIAMQRHLVQLSQVLERMCRASVAQCNPACDTEQPAPLRLEHPNLSCKLLHNASLGAWA